jgi:hypothetical protein
MYPKTVTQRIIDLQGKGFSAEKTKDIMAEQDKIHININTIYKHRSSPIGQAMIEEHLQTQRRMIYRASVPPTEEQPNTEYNQELALKYNNELLKIFIPQMTINLNKNINENRNTEKAETENQEYMHFSRVYNASNGHP